MKKFILIICFLLIASNCFGAQIIQTIPIMEQFISNQTEAFNPTDNSLGLVPIDKSKYTGVTKVEVWYSRKATQYGAPDSLGCQFRLWDATNAVAVTNSDAYGGTAWSIEVADITDYFNATTLFYVTPQIKAGGLQPYLYQCTVVIYQTISDVTNCSTRTIIPIGDIHSKSSTAAEVDEPARWFVDKTDYDGTVTAYFMATAKATDTSGNGIAVLRNRTDSSNVTTLAITSTTYTSFISADIWASITDDKEYTTFVGGTATITGYIANAFLIIDQTGSLTKFETQLYDLNFLLSTQVTDYFDWYYSGIKYSSWADCTRVVIAEYIMKTDAGLDTAWMRMVDDGVEMTNSEKSTTSSSYTRVTGTASTEPGADSIINTQGKVALGDEQIMATCGRLIITVTSMVNPTAAERRVILIQ